MIAKTSRLPNDDFALVAPRGVSRNDINKLLDEDRPVHDWYRFVLSYPPHLVRHYLAEFGVKEGRSVLDPFCGTGTTIVECKKLGINGIGVEANDLAYFATGVKVDWSIDPDGLVQDATKVAKAAHAVLNSQDISDDGLGRRTTGLISLPPESHRLLLADSISPLPLHKTLVLLGSIRNTGNPHYIRHQLLALAKAVVNQISNLHFGPEVGVGDVKKDAVVIATWLDAVQRIADDLRLIRKCKSAVSDLYRADARNIGMVLRPLSVDAVITSPPYPNEKDYTRTTRLESVLLGFLQDRQDLKALKKGLMRSNTRNVYKGDNDDRWVADHEEIQQIAEMIEEKRIRLGKTSGFERMYHKVTKLYFGGMARHLAELRPALKPGAKLAYVVGDQASYLQILIRTGKLLGEIAESLGYELVKTDLFRTRLATATRQQLREEAVILRWPGRSKS